MKWIDRLCILIALFIIACFTYNCQNGRYQYVLGQSEARFDTRTGLTEYYNGNHWVNVQNFKK